MNPIPQIKRAALLILDRAGIVPVANDILMRETVLGVSPKPLESDVENAISQLRRDGFIQSARNPLTDEVTWSLTASGIHQAISLR